MLEINGLHVSVDGQEVLRGVDLSIGIGETHAIMGPNGSGKSTLTNVLAGKPGYQITAGQILYMGEDLTAMDPDVRSKNGVFLAFQYPVELPGVRTWQFLKAAIDAKRTYMGLPDIGVREFDKLLKEKMEIVNMGSDLTGRSVNVGFSGGEKKRNEILQMILLDPKLALLDETDSGLDIDALRVVAEGINKFRNGQNALILVTHYQRILHYISPDRVHVLLDGRITLSGDSQLAQELEKKGYEWISGNNGSQ